MKVIRSGPKNLTFRHKSLTVTIPDLIEISFASTVLKAKAREDCLAGKVAKAIWEATSERPKENQRTLTNLFLRLQNTVGILSSSEQADRDERQGERSTPKGHHLRASARPGRLRW